MGPVRLGLLVCDHVRGRYLSIAGDYPEMFTRLFARHPQVELVVYDCIGGQVPSDPHECDGWITTGSRHSVNDEEQWIRDLEEFVAKVAARGTPFVGICFGHQLIAKALGGSVVRSERGWGVGVKEIVLYRDLPWVDDRPASVKLLHSNQDQVETLPPGAVVLGSSSHCPVSMMTVGDAMFGVQGHPEFDVAFVRALLEDRRGELIPEDTAVEGLASLDQGTDSEKLSDWIVRFVETYQYPENG